MATKSNLTRVEATHRAELISELDYRVSLDLTGDQDFGSTTRIRFRSRPGAATFLELMAHSVERIECNGRDVPVSAWVDGRIHLEDLAEENEVSVEARCGFWGAEVGMHHFVDPADGGVYLHTHLEPAEAQRVFACFDQPDLKGRFTFDVLAREGSLVISNGRATGEPEAEAAGWRWRFEPTEPISTYITAVCAGPYHAVHDRHGDIDLGVYCRASLRAFLDPEEILEITKQGFDVFQEAFGFPYPFGTKYDQVFIPESNSGAMENAACITFNDFYVFRSRVTDAARERRADTILHEMAHMWFGDLVTTRWWNDLWLNESFASYMAVFGMVEGTRFREAWTTFAHAEKGWAYRQDQLPTTHPIVAEVPDVQSIHLNFDGITYAKGASVLKQLVAWVGQDRFLDGIKRYTKRHAMGNATLEDFLVALEESCDRDLHEWSKEWLETPGVNTLRAVFDTEPSPEGGDRFTSFALTQAAPEPWLTLRSHRVAVGLYDDRDGTLVRRRRVELDAADERTDVPELVGETVPALLLVNDDDLTFAKIRLDPRSLATVVERLAEIDDSLARAVCWMACWDMTRDAELGARRFLRLVLNGIGRESEIGLVHTLIAQATMAANLYATPAHRPQARSWLADAALEHLRSSDAGGDHQLAWARAFAGSASQPDAVSLVKALLDGEDTVPGLVVDAELRWHFLVSLVSVGAAGEAEIAAEVERDHTDQGHRHAARARAAMPDAGAKRASWDLAVNDGTLPLALLEELMDGFHQFGQEELLSGYVDRYFDALPAVWEGRDLPEALAFTRGMYPRLVVSQDTVDRTARHLARDDVPSPVRRILMEGQDGLERALRAHAADAAEA